MSTNLSLLFLLDNLLLSGTDSQDANNTASKSNHDQPMMMHLQDALTQEDTRKSMQRRMVLLEAVDFLVGDALLDAALNLLDSSAYTVVPAVRLVKAHPSNRSLFRVRASASSQQSKTSTQGKRRRGTGGTDTASEYICFLGLPSASSGKEDNLLKPHAPYQQHDASVFAAGRVGFYCNCRSFFERCKADPSGAALCKHLLAARLAPFLIDESDHFKCYLEETVSDEEYADILVRRIM